MKKEVVSLFCVFALLGGTTAAFAGAYGEKEQPEELPASPPPAPMMESAPAPAPAKVLREYFGFMTDAETARGLWAEVGSIYSAESDFGGDVDFVDTNLKLAYGQEMWEVGASIGYDYIHLDSSSTFSGGSDDGFNDLKLWGKVIPLRTDMFQAGLGLVTSFPTGNDPFTTDEYGFEPFVTVGVGAGPASLRGSFGYMTSTGHGDDTLDTEVALLGSVADWVNLRAEVLWLHALDVDFDPVTLAPGIDFVFPVADGWDLLVRPQGGVGLDEDAPDWQLGVSLAITQS